MWYPLWEPKEIPNCQTAVSEKVVLGLKLPETYEWLVYFTEAEADGVIIRRGCGSDWCSGSQAFTVSQNLLSNYPLLFAMQSHVCASGRWGDTVLCVRTCRHACLGMRVAQGEGWPFCAFKSRPRFFSALCLYIRERWNHQNFQYAKAYTKNNFFSSCNSSFLRPHQCNRSKLTA